MKKCELFDGRYKILKVLGEGGMSTVYLAENVNLGTLWAIKEINKVSNSKVDLLVEPNILKKLKHPALPRIFDIIESDNSIYIIKDYIEGISLDKKLLRSGKIPEQTVIMWSIQICEVLIYLHNLKPNPIIYRDMKPSNIMLTKDNRIKLVDFGIAREYKMDSRNDTAHIGTRGYAAPEQYGLAQSDVRTDIYGLGVTLYHLLTGKSPKEAPYEIRPIREIDESLSIGIEHVIDVCTKPNPDHRYQSVEELVGDLENIDEINRGYRKKGIGIKLKLAIMIFLLSIFSYITYLGFIKIIGFFKN